jgi:hypothetical protein
VPGRSLRGARYYLSPADPNHLPVPVDVARGWSDYQLCYWYCLEIEARARVLRARLEPAGVRFHELELGAIQDQAGVLALGRALELGALSPLGRLRLARLLQRRSNTKPEQKRALALGPAELEAAERAVRSALGEQRAPAAQGASNR